MPGVGEKFWILVIGGEWKEPGHWHIRMWPELCEALEQAGIVSRHELPDASVMRVVFPACAGIEVAFSDYGFVLYQALAIYDQIDRKKTSH